MKTYKLMFPNHEHDYSVHGTGNFVKALEEEKLISFVPNARRDFGDYVELKFRYEGTVEHDKAKRYECWVSHEGLQNSEKLQFHNTHIIQLCHMIVTFCPWSTTH